MENKGESPVEYAILGTKLIGKKYLESALIKESIRTLRNQDYYYGFLGCLLSNALERERGKVSRCYEYPPKLFWSWNWKRLNQCCGFSVVLI